MWKLCSALLRFFFQNRIVTAAGVRAIWFELYLDIFADDGSPVSTRSTTRRTRT